MAVRCDLSYRCAGLPKAHYLCIVRIAALTGFHQLGSHTRRGRIDQHDVLLSGRWVKKVSPDATYNHTKAERRSREECLNGKHAGRRDGNWTKVKNPWRCPVLRITVLHD
jgi:hypothetical protein